MGYSPNLWGKEAWKFIHFVALSYNPTPANEITYLKFFESLPTVLPCPICGQHFKENMAKYPPNMRSNKELFEWTVDMHNIVNEENGKPIYSYNNALKDLMPPNGYKVQDFYRGALVSFGALALILLITKTIYKK